MLHIGDSTSVTLRICELAVNEKCASWMCKRNTLVQHRLSFYILISYSSDWLPLPGEWDLFTGHLDLLRKQFDVVLD